MSGAGTARTSDKLDDGATLLRDLGELTQASLPSGLLKDHSLKDSVWGKLEILSGGLRFVWQSPDRDDQMLAAGDVVIIPPLEIHHLETDGDFTLKLALYKT